MDITMILIIAGMVAVYYIFMVRPQRKKQKEEKAMRDNLPVGDCVTSIGGFIGRVACVKENTVIIETSEDRVRIELAKWAISKAGKEPQLEPAR